jgi:hypothetical protein
MGRGGGPRLSTGMSGAPKRDGAAGGFSDDPVARFEAPRAGLEPATNRLHRVPPFPTGVDYLITVSRADP